MLKDPVTLTLIKLKAILLKPLLEVVFQKPRFFNFVALSLTLMESYQLLGVYACSTHFELFIK